MISHAERNRKPATVVMLDAIIDAIEWSGSCLGKKPADALRPYPLVVSQLDFEVLQQYIGIHRRHVVIYRHCAVSGDAEKATNAMFNFWGRNRR